MSNIKLTREGYEKLRDEIQKLRGMKVDIPSTGGSDSFDDEEAKRQYDRINGLIVAKSELLNSAEIVDTEVIDGLVNIDDYLRCKISYSEDDNEETIIHLIGTRDISIKDGVQHISINSPLGAAIFGQPIGSFVKYKVGNDTYGVVIKEKVNQDELTLTK